jgi:hypothetical protein
MFCRSAEVMYMAHIVQIHIEQAGRTRDLLSVSLMCISGDLGWSKVSLRSGNLKELVRAHFPWIEILDSLSTLLPSRVKSRTAGMGLWGMDALEGH